MGSNWCPRTGKVSYASASDAQAAALRQNQRPSGHRGLRAYKCEHRSAHHVGHPRRVPAMLQRGWR